MWPVYFFVELTKSDNSLLGRKKKAKERSNYAKLGSRLPVQIHCSGL